MPSRRLDKGLSWGDVNRTRSFQLRASTLALVSTIAHRVATGVYSERSALCLLNNIKHGRMPKTCKNV